MSLRRDLRALLLGPGGIIWLILCVLSCGFAEPAVLFTGALEPVAKRGPLSNSLRMIESFEQLASTKSTP